MDSPCESNNNNVPLARDIFPCNLNSLSSRKINERTRPDSPYAFNPASSGTPSRMAVAGFGNRADSPGKPAISRGAITALVPAGTTSAYSLFEDPDGPSGT